MTNHDDQCLSATHCPRNRPWAIGRGIAQNLNPFQPIDYNARRGDRQPVAPFASENLRAPVKRLGQPNATRIVMAERASARRLNLVRGPAGRYRLRKDENPDPDRTAALNRVARPAAARRGSRPWPAARDHRGATGRDRRPSRPVRRAVVLSSLLVVSPRRHRNPGDADRTKPPLGLLELLHEASVPTSRQVNVLVDANDDSCSARSRPRFRPSPHSCSSSPQSHRGARAGRDTAKRADCS